MHISTAHTFNFSWDDTDDTHMKRRLTHTHTHTCVDLYYNYMQYGFRCECVKKREDGGHRRAESISNPKIERVKEMRNTSNFKKWHNFYLVSNVYRMWALLLFVVVVATIIINVYKAYMYLVRVRTSAHASL